MKTISRIVFGLALVLAWAFVATNGTAHGATQPVPSWAAKVAAFYSGGNMRSEIRCDWTNTLGTTGMAGSGDIRLNPSECKSLWALQKYGPRDLRGMVLGAHGLATLIHESLHNLVQPGWDNTDEIVIGDLGWRLVPDAMQRFFGVKLNSYWGKRYRAMVLKTLAP